MTEDSIRLSAGRPAERSEARTQPRATPGLPVPIEAIVLAVVAIAVLVAAAVADNFEAPAAWGMVTLLGVAFILSRGLAERGRGGDRL